MDKLAQLLYLYGVGYEFQDYNGHHHTFEQQTRQQVLSECGINWQDENVLTELNYQLDIAKWQQLVESVTIVSQASPCLTIRLPSDSRLQHIELQVAALQYHCQGLIKDAAITGHYHYEGCDYLQLEVPIADLPIGYHQAEVIAAGESHSTELWVTPEQCFDPLEPSTRLLGLSVQLYTLQPSGNKACADFYELRQLIEAAATRQVDYILLNPLHLLFLSQPERASPYSPNDRRLLHPLYVSVELICERYDLEYDFAEEPKQDGDYLDMTAAIEQKLLRLREVWQQLQQKSELWQSDYQRFCLEKQQQLKTLQDDPFQCFMQWQAFAQLAQCQHSAKAAGMSVGLVNDLAVGCAEDSNEYLSNKALYSQTAKVGAPPDPWAETGQNWGLPALDPVKLKAQNFAFFKQLIQANFSGVGGLRIDHVMGLRRLWWCFMVEQQQRGCYVYYPFEYLLAILKIESVLNQVMVIGEDLGVVPVEVKTAMAESHIYSNILFYFEKDHQGQFLAPEHYRQQALLMIANHDVPPFYGWWQHGDLELKQRLQLLPPQQYQQQQQARREEREKLCQWLQWHSQQTVTMDSPTEDVYTALVTALAGSKAKLFTLQLDDLDCQHLPVNIPGTDTEYPNWRRKLSASCTEIIARSAAILDAAATSRKV
ncbi:MULTISPECIES: 4-alpha-glucanotransferase [unclassified Pseudoalteromonas]|uniref:4-alpha-glucanotransferase n=1 Tax=unclassified Pseudoalteromonas TaxID=194690 RepID=UPI003014F9C0